MKTPSLPTLFLILALGSALIIGSALFSQYVLAMDPCGLCLRQRLGHYVAIPMALTAALSFARRSGGSRPVSMILSVVVLLALGFSLYWASFHIGVEQKWWPGLESCGGGGDTSDISLEQWLNPEGGAPAYVPCDQPTIIFGWFFGGASMATVHALLLLPLTLLSAFVVVRAFRKSVN